MLLSTPTFKGYTFEQKGHSSYFSTSITLDHMKLKTFSYIGPGMKEHRTRVLEQSCSALFYRTQNRTEHENFLRSRTQNRTEQEKFLHHCSFIPGSGQTLKILQRATSVSLTAKILPLASSRSRPSRELSIISNSTELASTKIKYGYYETLHNLCNIGFLLRGRFSRFSSKFANLSDFY